MRRRQLCVSDEAIRDVVGEATMGHVHDSGCFIKTSLVYSVYTVDALQCFFFSPRPFSSLHPKNPIKNGSSHFGRNHHD